MKSISSRPQISSLKVQEFPICIRKYNYRYIDYKTPIYAISTLKDENVAKDKKNAHYKDIQYYTAPFIMSDASRSENVLVSFICPYQTNRVQMDLLDTFDIKTDMMKLSLGDLSYYVSILHTPLVTILNSYCHRMDAANGVEPEYDIFYTRKYLDVQDYEKKLF